MSKAKESSTDNVHSSQWGELCDYYISFISCEMPDWWLKFQFPRFEAMPTVTLAQYRSKTITGETANDYHYKDIWHKHKNLNITCNILSLLQPLSVPQVSMSMVQIKSNK